MRRIDRLLAAALFGAAIGFAGSADACTVGVAGVAFGAYDLLSPAPDDSTGTIEVLCHPRDHAPIVSLGTGGSGSYAVREMSNGTDALEYNLFTSAARAIVWGDGTMGSATVTLSGGDVNAGTRRFVQPIHGRIPARQSVSYGSYSDTLFVTVSF